MGVAQGLASQALFLFDLGRVAAPLGVLEPVPEDLRADFEAALEEARVIALEAATAPGRYDADEYAHVLYAAAGLSGRTRLAVGWCFLSMSGMPYEAEVECQHCGAYLLGTISDSEEGMVFEAVDARVRPISEESPVQPREAPEVRWDARHPPEGDFEWLAALCLAAGQDAFIGILCNLYGTGTCPVCEAPFLVMNEIERSHTR
ncbi:hypothetical protein [Vitiosangium sp. GDMCC 1.1324]|uniref:hypothetical protein n=1 Tax=Vitiosangium sp. (strain GDMCC 1.1324) TaxID=2138576 RepID=UPI000D37DDCD|nr:hypothetical protein [Vitiosangium sp. GDMCC 1.1324]PTL81189.1 hypothetical protein DAT35_23990 [Vitiosangium sp. GDMCC 1.1324]